MLANLLSTLWENESLRHVLALAGGIAAVTMWYDKLNVLVIGQTWIDGKLGYAVVRKSAS